jgi:hypothetical protein
MRPRRPTEITEGTLHTITPLPPELPYHLTVTTVCAIDISWYF